MIPAPVSNPDLRPLSLAERKAYATVAAELADERGLVNLAARTVLRLLAQVTAQEQQLALYQDREAGLPQCAQGAQGIASSGIAGGGGKDDHPHCPALPGGGADAGQA